MTDDAGKKILNLIILLHLIAFIAALINFIKYPTKGIETAILIIIMTAAAYIIMQCIISIIEIKIKNILEEGNRKNGRS